MQSFCHNIKESLINKDKYPSIDKSCCWHTILFAFLSFKNYQLADNSKIEIRLEEEYLSKLLEQCLKSLKVNFHKEIPSGTNLNYRKKVSEANGELQNNSKVIQKFFIDSSIVTDNISKLNQAPENKCCSVYWLKVAFLCVGYLSDPAKNYHLEFFSTKNNIENIKKVLQEEDIESKFYQKGNDSENFILYIKKSDDLIHFLAVIGANKHLLEIENVRIEKEIKNNIIRQINYETANLEKTIESSVKYINSIEWAIDTGFFSELPESLREIAMLRIKYPEMNLRELCEQFEKPITKSGINHRLRRLYGIIQKEKSKVV